MTRSVVAVVTLAHGRHAHLRAQLAALAAGTRLPDIWVGAAMDDELLESVVRHQASSSRPAEQDRGRPPAPAPRAPPARGRSQRRRSARDRSGVGPARLPRRRLHPRRRRLVERYGRRPVGATPGSHRRWSGAVHYLPPRTPGSLTAQRNWSGRTRIRPSGRPRWRSPGRRGPSALLVALLRRHGAHLATSRRLRRGLRRLRWRGHRLRDEAGASGRPAVVGRRRSGIPPAPRGGESATAPSRRHRAQQQPVRAPLGLVPHGGVARGLR